MTQFISDLDWDGNDAHEQPKPKMKYGIEHQLHPETQLLVQEFSMALMRKLYAAQEKYRYTNEWKSADPRALRHELAMHVHKGDPLDVAAYCAFLWAMGEPTE